MGFDLIERLRFLASLCLAGTAQTQGGGVRVANNHFIPNLFISGWTISSHTLDKVKLLSNKCLANV